MPCGLAVSFCGASWILPALGVKMSAGGRAGRFRTTGAAHAGSVVCPAGLRSISSSRAPMERFRALVGKVSCSDMPPRSDTGARVSSGNDVCDEVGGGPGHDELVARDPRLLPTLGGRTWSGPVGPHERCESLGSCHRCRRGVSGGGPGAGLCRPARRSTPSHRPRPATRGSGRASWVPATRRGAASSPLRFVGRIAAARPSASGPKRDHGVCRVVTQDRWPSGGEVSTIRRISAAVSLSSSTTAEPVNCLLRRRSTAIHGGRAELAGSRLDHARGHAFEVPGCLATTYSARRWALTITRACRVCGARQGTAPIERWTCATMSRRSDLGGSDVDPCPVVWAEFRKPRGHVVDLHVCGPSTCQVDRPRTLSGGGRSFSSVTGRNWAAGACWARGPQYG